MTTDIIDKLFKPGATKAFVHRYKWSHRKRFTWAKTLLRRGQIRLIETSDTGWLYEKVEKPDG